MFPNGIDRPSAKPLRRGGVGEAYSDVPNRRFAAVLAAEDLAEDHGASPFERTTCRTHRRWIHQCIASPIHVILVTGHRWCRACQAVSNVAVDELAGSVRVVCSRCQRVPSGIATQQIVRSCQASMALARRDQHETTTPQLLAMSA